MNNLSQINKNEILDDIFDNTFVGIALVSTERIITVVNDAFCKLFRYEKDDILGESVHILHIDQDHFTNFRNLAFNKIVQNQPVSIEYEFLRKDGTTFWGKISGNPTKDKNNFLWMIVDISETIEIKNKLKEQTNLLKTVIDENPNPIILKNYDAKFVLVNKATSNLYNSTPEEMIGKDDEDFIPDKELAKFFKKNVQEIMKNGKTEIVYEDSIDVKTNEVKNYMSIKKPFKNQLQEDFILVIANDVTELNKKNRELIEKEKIIFQQGKLASMGEMIGNIAHQWRQPLSSISILASGIKLQRELDILKNEDFLYAMDNILNSTQYLSQTIEDFRSFYDPKNSKISKFDIQELIKKTLSLVNSQLKNKNIELIENIDNFEITTFQNELIQVFVNILNNARDALLENQEKKFIRITTYKDSQSGYIEIMDNAGGVPTDVIDKIFEPYFTTKHKALGSGIGLYMSDEIIKKHLKGSILVENKTIEIDKIKYMGAKFTIKLPLKL